MRTLYHPNREEIRLSSVLYALSDQIRLKIVNDLLTSGEQSCGALNIPIAKSTLSHHFKVLRESGVMYTRIEGTQRFISIRTEDLNKRFPRLLDVILQATEPY
ncbi:DNA-binding transcriptional regulator, ArsR family [Bacillus sp. 491mf]|uniref:ArsR/SmtB family transcription factor n=1 Tax=Bacillus TaxID=1386 RepID=UPI000552DD93|nr:MULTISPECIES: ArsR family transcriptional regulator [unclassified Bacillus (in: firmicutes)]SFC93625.1 DNA-binding transcriptional regulator, ArsR family [Bacillus sp. 491mf]